MNSSIFIFIVDRLLSNSRFSDFPENFYRGDKDVLVTLIH